MRFFLFFIIIYNFISCATKSHRNIPSWVQHLETGESSLTLELQNEYYFRAIAKVDVFDVSICDKAVKKAYDYVLNEYVSTEGMPYRVMVMYEIREGFSCAATISVKKKDLVLAAKLEFAKEDFEEQKNDYEENIRAEIEDLGSRKKSYEVERKRLLEERSSLQQVAKETVLISNNNKKIKYFLDKSREEVRRDEKNVEQYVFYNMLYRDFLKIFDKESVDMTYSYDSPCYKQNTERTSDITIHRFYHVCWKKVGYSKANHLLIGLCDIRTNNCFRNLSESKETQNKIAQPSILRNGRLQQLQDYYQR